MSKTMLDDEATALLKKFDETGQLVINQICIDCSYNIIYTIIENRKDARISLNYMGQGLFDLVILGKKAKIRHEFNKMLYEDNPDRLELDKQEILDKIKEIEDLVKNLH